MNERRKIPRSGRRSIRNGKRCTSRDEEKKKVRNGRGGISSSDRKYEWEQEHYYEEEKELKKGQN